MIRQKVQTYEAREYIGYHLYHALLCAEAENKLLLAYLVRLALEELESAHPMGAGVADQSDSSSAALVAS